MTLEEIEQDVLEAERRLRAGISEQTVRSLRGCAAQGAPVQAPTPATVATTRRCAPPKRTSVRPAK